MKIIPFKEWLSTPKWHLAHTTWFGEEFITKYLQIIVFIMMIFFFLFNSYYNNVGKRVLRPLEV
jgi:hypothetical protein